ncbi:hypothetical protein BZL30_3613 [Mycobacterium kansasii]|uniref:Cytochrome C biogenesis transmembrane region family protein n=1 Tax=Mycobacterium kansasii TaxID=1768 RepID=A0A1V3X8G3_MYCKA|nr:hypothetical protein BZL30_3613 [Mycobacterium kansasii]
MASLSCTIGPFLALISTTFRHGSTVTGVLAFLVYASGMAITVGVAALTVAFVGSSATGGLRRILPYVGRIAGALLLLTGLYVTYYGYYEISLYFSGASADDPVIAAAGTVQSWAVRHVDALGYGPCSASSQRSARPPRDGEYWLAAAYLVAAAHCVTDVADQANRSSQVVTPYNTA